MVAHAQSLLIPNAYADARFYKEADQQTGFRTRSILCAPLKHNGEVIGVLQILNPRDKESFDEQELEGFTAYANLTATAIEKLRALERMRAQERVERDLAIASDIQRELLARAIPSRIPGAVFAAHNQAASNVGGDFYNVSVRSPYETYFAIGDVSGKGISASLLMAQTLSAMQFVFATTTSPADALVHLNSTLGDRIIRGKFVTTLVGRVIPSADRVELASAGHLQAGDAAFGRLGLRDRDGRLPAPRGPAESGLPAGQDRFSPRRLAGLLHGRSLRVEGSVGRAFEQEITPVRSRSKISIAASRRGAPDPLRAAAPRREATKRRSDDPGGRVDMKVKYTFTSDSHQLAEVRHCVRSFLRKYQFDECLTELLVLGLDGLARISFVTPTVATESR